MKHECRITVLDTKCFPEYEYETFARDIDVDCDRFISIYDDPENPENYLELRYDAENVDTVVAAVSAVLSPDYLRHS